MNGAARARINGHFKRPANRNGLPNGITQNDVLSTLTIPRADGTLIEVPVDEENLPNVDELLSVLKDENAPLKTFSQFAARYWDADRKEDFKKLVDNGISKAKLYEHEHIEDQVFLHTLRAAFFVEAAKNERHRDNREECLAEVTASHEIVDSKISDDADEDNAHVFVGKAMKCDLDGTHADQRRDTNLNTAFIYNKKFVPGLLLRAQISFRLGNYEKALKDYEAALKECLVGCPPEVRLGIGLCHLKLKNNDLARKAFEIVYNMKRGHKGSVPAIIGLAALELNATRMMRNRAKAKTPEERAEFKKRDNARRQKQMKAFQKVGKYYEEAYSLCPNDPNVLIYLADRCFFIGEFEKAERYATEARKSLKGKDRKLDSVRNLTAMSHWLVAKTFHAQDEFEKALTNYSMAHKIAKSGSTPSTLAAFGLAQINIYREKYDAALKHLAEVRKEYPYDFQTLKTIGYLHWKLKNMTQAREVLDLAARLGGKDVEVPVLKALVLEHFDPKLAVEAYEDAIRKMRKQKVPIHPSIYNNMAVLQFESGDFEKALATFDRLLNEMEAQNEKIVKPYKLTLSFNLACGLEAHGRTEEAFRKYKSTCSKKGGDEHFLACTLRMGIIDRDAGRLDRAIERFQKVLTRDQKNLNAMSLLGQLYMDKGDILKAKEQFRKCLEVDKNDSYNLVALGNMYVNSMDARNKFEQMGKAAKYFEKALQLDPRNAYAANAMGVLMAESGWRAAAKNLFTRVREGAPTMAEVWINLGHCHLYDANYSSAQTMYEKALTLIPTPAERLPIQLALARALYMSEGKNAECKKVLQKILHINPQYDEAWYDLALAEEESSIAILQKDPHQRTLEEVKLADKQLRLALKIFTRLQTSPRIPREKCQRHASYCRDNLKRSESHVEFAKQTAAERSKDRQEKAARMEEQRRKRLEKEQAAKKAKEDAEKKRKEMAAESEKRLRMMKEQWQLEADIESTAPRKKRQKIPEDPSVNPYARVKADIGEPDMFAEYVDEADDDDEEFQPQADNPDDHMIRPEEDGEDMRYDAVLDAQLRAADAVAAAGGAVPSDSGAMVDDGGEVAPKRLKRLGKKRKKRVAAMDDDDEEMKTEDGADDGATSKPKKKARRVIDDDDEEEMEDAIVVEEAAIENGADAGADAEAGGAVEVDMPPLPMPDAGGASASQDDDSGAQPSLPTPENELQERILACLKDNILTSREAMEHMSKKKVYEILNVDYGFDKKEVKKNKEMIKLVIPAMVNFYTKS